MGTVLEEIFLGAAVLALLLWGRQKIIPETARILAYAKNEFDRALREISSGGQSTTAVHALTESAKRLGIDVSGKTWTQLLEEIVSKAQHN